MKSPKPVLFAHTPEDELLSYGVPAEWLDDVRLADEDSLLVLADRLPAEAAELDAYDAWVAEHLLVWPKSDVTINPCVSLKTCEGHGIWNPASQ